MSFLLKVLSDTSPKPLATFSFRHLSKPKVKLVPTDLIYPAPLSSLDIGTARNPNQFGLTDGISVSPRWPCKLSVTYYNYFSLIEMCNRSHRVCLTNSLFDLFWNRSHRAHAFGLTKMRFCPIPSTSVPPRFLTFTFWTESVSLSSSIRSDRVACRSHRKS